MQAADAAASSRLLATGTGQPSQAVEAAPCIFAIRAPDALRALLSTQAYSSLLTVFIEDVCAKHGDKPGVPFEELVTRLNSELGLEGSETEDPEILTR